MCIYIIIGIVFLSLRVWIVPANSSFFKKMWRLFRLAALLKLKDAREAVIDEPDTEAEEVASAEVAVEADERDTAMLTRYGVLRGGCSRCRGGGKKRRCPESCYVSGARKFVRLMVELD